jgi:hypothetical protein
MTPFFCGRSVERERGSGWIKADGQRIFLHWRGSAPVADDLTRWSDAERYGRTTSTQTKGQRALTLVKWLSDHAIARWTHPLPSFRHADHRKPGAGLNLTA